jgi:hypothetical protein
MYTYYIHYLLYKLVASPPSQSTPPPPKSLKLKRHPPLPVRVRQQREAPTFQFVDRQGLKGAGGGFGGNGQDARLDAGAEARAVFGWLVCLVCVWCVCVCLCVCVWWGGCVCDMLDEVKGNESVVAD